MRKNKIIIYILEFFIFLYSFIQFFLIKKFSYSVLLLFLFLLFILGKKFLNFHRRNERSTKDSILIICISVLLYWLITYILGYFSGFLYNSYSTNFLSIIKNMFFQICFIIIIELLRSVVLKNNDLKMAPIIFSILCFSFIEITTKTSLNQLNSNLIFMKFLFSVIMPIISKNILLSFLTINCGHNSSMIYRFLMELPIFVVPIIPNFGYYVENLIITILPLIILLILYKIYYSDNNKVVCSRNIGFVNKISTFIYGIVVVLLFVIIILVSGIGRLIVYTIGSGSMEKTICIGDVVIIDKKDKKIDNKDIIAFKHNDVILVHRVVNIIKDDYGTYYQTKGDNNDDNDAWLVKKDEVVGTYKFRIRFIGWPTVWLNEWLLGGD